MEYKVKKQDCKTTLIECDNGAEYCLNTFTFASISDQESNPLFCVSVSNNSFSIDLWRGCLLDCAYCHVQGCFYDLIESDSKITMHYAPVRRNNSTIQEVVESLVHHPSFIPDYSLISLCTSSTEPFLNEEVTSSTIAIMLEFVRKGFKNPFWIVTKMGGIANHWEPEIREIIESGSKILISVCWTNNLPEIEPMRGDRFKNLRWMTDCGVLLNWYMRPLVREWNASTENLRFIMEKVGNLDLPFLNIVAGGLRWTEGIEFGMRMLHNLPLPEIAKDDNIKTLYPDTIINIKKIHDELLPEIPLFFKSSCAVSHALSLPNLNCWQFMGDVVQCENCPTEQYMRCHHIFNHLDINRINEELTRRQCGCQILFEDGTFRIEYKVQEYKAVSTAKKQVAFLLLNQIT